MWSLFSIHLIFHIIKGTENVFNVVVAVKMIIKKINGWRNDERFYSKRVLTAVTSVLMTVSRTRVYAAKLKAMFWIGRPYMWIFPISSVVLGMALTNDIRIDDFVSFGIAAVIIPCIINYFMVTFNAVFDVEADRINKPDRPLVTGELSRGEALVASLLSMVLAIILAFFFLTPAHVIILILVLLMGIAYSTPFPRIKGITLLGNVWFGTGYVFIGLLFGWSYFRSIEEVDLLFLLVGLVLTIHATFISVSKDLVDYEGDRLAGYRTIPVVFGEKAGATFVLLSLWLPILLLPIIFMLLGQERLVTSLGLLYAILIPWAAYESYRQLQIVKSPRYLSEKSPSYKQRFLTLYLFTIELVWGLILIFIYS